MSAKTGEIRLADWIFKRLADIGVKHVFLLPGGGAMYLNDALACENRIRPIPCHHEQSCGIAAEAYGRATTNKIGNFGVALVTTGPGATNIITPVAGAWLDSLPLLIISGQVKRSDRLNGRQIRQGGVQEIEIIPLVRSITKYAVTLDDPLSIRFHLEKALYEMISGRPGPVWIDIPLDLQAVNIQPEKLPKFQPGLQDNPQNNNIQSSIFKLLKRAKRPLLLVGHGVRISGGANSFQQLVERLNIPCVFTWNALDLLPYEHPLNIGRPGVVATRGANFAVQNCDLLIAIGARLDNITTAFNLEAFARSACKVVVDIDENELTNKSNMGINHAIRMDAKDFINQLLKGVTGDISNWQKTCLTWKKKYPLETKIKNARGSRIGHAEFVEALSEVTPKNTLITTGSSGLAIEFFYAGFKNKIGQRIFLTSGLGAMGYGLPAALGACLARNCEPMLAIESDGSLQLNLQELATIAHLKLPICLLVLNNNGYASIRNTQRTYFQERYIASNLESGLAMPDLKKIAGAYSLKYKRISNPGNLAKSLLNAQILPRPCLIEINLKEQESLEPKCAAIPQSDGSMLSMPLEDMSPLLSIEQLSSEMITGLDPRSIKAREKLND